MNLSRQDVKEDDQGGNYMGEAVEHGSENNKSNILLVLSSSSPPPRSGDFLSEMSALRAQQRSSRVTSDSLSFTEKEINATSVIPSNHRWCHYHCSSLRF